MRDDDLHRPLGQDPARPSSIRSAGIGRILSRTAVVLGFCAAAGLAAALALALSRADPHGGDPIVVAALPPAQPLQPAAVPQPAPLQAAADPMPTGSTRANAVTPAPRVEGGVTVVRAAQGQAPGQAPGPLIIKVPQALGLSEVAGVDRRLVEGTRYGPLPKIAADGARPSEVYARPLVFTGTVPTGTPRIAIVVADLGLDAATTDAAIRTLPPAVTLAFSPYGQALEAAATRAKAAGHEVLLQIAAANGGDGPQPHALRAGATPRETVDDLHWLMSRMSGYVGIGNFHGASLAADHAAMTTMLQELDERGVLYVEGKTTPAGAPSAAAGLPTARADFVLDAVADAASLRAATVQLEAAARAKSTAILAVDASPAALATLDAFVQALDARGLALVPVSALASVPGPTLARAR